jgi:hypothetical protein
MKAASWSLLMVLVPLSAGCLDLPKPGSAAQKPDDLNLKSSPLPKAEGLTAAPARKPVAADQITEANAHQMADAIEDEIARDEQALLQPAETPRPAPKKK